MYCRNFICFVFSFWRQKTMNLKKCYQSSVNIEISLDLKVYFSLITCKINNFNFTPFDQSDHWNFCTVIIIQFIYYRIINDDIKTNRCYYHGFSLNIISHHFETLLFRGKCPNTKFFCSVFGLFSTVCDQESCKLFQSLLWLAF